MFNFNVFSRRAKKETSKKVPLKKLTPEFKNRFFMLIQEPNWGVPMEQVFMDTRSMMMMSIGRGIGEGGNDYFGNHVQTMAEFMWSCEDSHFFDVVEYMFQTQSGKMLIRRDDFIDRVNQLFNLDDLPYKLSYGKIDEIRSDDGDSGNGLESFGRSLSYDFTFPKIIRKDSEVIDSTAIEPVLALLRGKEYREANKEFMSSLEDYRHSKYRDSVTKCCSAFESVMKITCEKRGITLKGRETAGPLISMLLKDMELPIFYDQPLMIIGTIRNKLGIAHGSGSEEKAVSENMALYSINATAAAILLLTGE